MDRRHFGATDLAAELVTTIARHGGSHAPGSAHGPDGATGLGLTTVVVGTVVAGIVGMTIYWYWGTWTPVE